MANENELFDQRIHDAYERVELSGEAQQRMLAHLLVAQYRAQAELDETAAPDQGEEPEALLEEGLGMANMVPPQSSASAPRRARPKHWAPVAKPAAEEAQAAEVLSASEPEVLTIPEADAAVDESLQKTTIVRRGKGPKHFKVNTTPKTVKVQAVEEVPAQESEQVPAPLEEEPSQVQKKGRWKLLLPLAAVLVVALVVVQVTGVLRAPKDVAKDAASEQYAQNVAREDAAGTAYESEEAADAQADAAPEAAVPADAAAPASDADAEGANAELANVDYYPYITMDDGRTLTALRDGLYTEQIEPSKLGFLAGEATASSFDAPDEAAVKCYVYDVEGEDAYAVQYEGETTYWRCTIIER